MNTRTAALDADVVVVGAFKGGETAAHRLTDAGEPAPDVAVTPAFGPLPPLVVWTTPRRHRSVQ